GLAQGRAAVRGCGSHARRGGGGGPLYRRETRAHLAHTAQMRQQIIELQNQWQEIVARQLGLLLAVRHHVFKRVDAAGDALEVERRGLALDAVQLAEQSAELLAELRVAARRLPEDAVDEVQAGLGAVQE